jgi:thiamine biosynthesis lipoprotein
MTTFELVAWEWRAMGTTWRIYHAGTVDRATAAEIASLVEQDEQRWSRFRPDSELQRLNRYPGEWQDVSAETAELFEAAIRWHQETDGVFQPLVGKHLIAWGYEHSLAEQPPGVGVSPAPAPVVDSQIRLGAGRHRVHIPRGAAVDLGGIAKGWSADRAAERLRRRAPFGPLLVDAGGDIAAVRGVHTVAVAWSGDVTLQPGSAIATSGYDTRSWRNGDGVEAHHLIDPKTGAPAPRARATVIADTVTAADVLATSLAIRPALIDGRTEACLLDAGGRVRSTDLWRGTRAA